MAICGRANSTLTKILRNRIYVYLIIIESIGFCQFSQHAEEGTKGS